MHKKIVLIKIIKMRSSRLVQHVLTDFRYAGSLINKRSPSWKKMFITESQKIPFSEKRKTGLFQFYLFPFFSTFFFWNVSKKMSEIRFSRKWGNFPAMTLALQPPLARDTHESTVYLLRRQRIAVLDSVPRDSVFKV